MQFLQGVARDYFLLIIRPLALLSDDLSDLIKFHVLFISLLERIFHSDGRSVFSTNESRKLNQFASTKC